MLPKSDFMVTSKETKTHESAQIEKSTAKKPARARKSAAAAGTSDVPQLRIRVRAYEHKILDASLRQIMDTAARYDAEIHGPVPLPTEIKKYTVNRSSFIDKNSREQFEMRTHRRLLDIVDPTPQTVDALMKLDLAAGVDVEIKL